MCGREGSLSTHNCTRNSRPSVQPWNGLEKGICRGRPGHQDGRPELPRHLQSFQGLSCQMVLTCEMWRVCFVLACGGDEGLLEWEESLGPRGLTPCTAHETPALCWPEVGIRNLVVDMGWTCQPIRTPERGMLHSFWAADPSPASSCSVERPCPGR